MNTPIHSIFVHFPAGLIPIAVLFFLIFLYTRRIIFERISISVLGFSFIFLIFSIITGLYDWLSRYHLFMSPVLILKFFLSLMLLSIITIIWITRNKYSNNNNISTLSRRYSYVLLYMSLFPITFVTGFFGAQLNHPIEKRFRADSIEIGSEIFRTKCATCHPYGQGIYDPLIFPDVNGSFGSASLVHSSLFGKPDSLLNYIRSPKNMPVIDDEKLSEFDFKYLYEYLKYLKYGEQKTTIKDTLLN